MGARGKPSRWEGQREHVHCAVDLGHVLAHAGEDAGGEDAQRPRHLGRDGVGLLGVGPAHDEEPHGGTARARTWRAASSRSRRPFSATSRPTKPTTGASSGIPSPALTRRPASGEKDPGSKRRRSIPLPRSRILAAGAIPSRMAVSTSSSFWERITSEQRAASFSTAEVEAPGPRLHAVVEVEAVEGVHHHRHSREPGRDLGQEAGFRIVRVHDREPLPAHQAIEGEEGTQVRKGREAAGHGHGLVLDPAHGQLGRVFAGRGHARNRVAAVDDGLELAQEQVAEGDRGRRDVGDGGGLERYPGGSLSAGAAEGAREGRLVALHHDPEVVAVQHEPAGIGGEPRPRRDVRQEPVDRVGETARVAGSHEQAGDAVLDDLAALRPRPTRPRARPPAWPRATTSACPRAAGWGGRPRSPARGKGPRRPRSRRRHRGHRALEPPPRERSGPS